MNVSHLIAKGTVYSLSGSLGIAIVVAAYYATLLPSGREKKNYSVEILHNHRRWLKICGVLLLFIVLVVEGVIVPIFGRHYTPLLAVHLCLCFLAILFAGIAWRYDGLRHAPLHNLFGTLAFGIGFAMVCTGIAVTTQLPQ